MHTCLISLFLTLNNLSFAVVHQRSVDLKVTHLQEESEGVKKFTPSLLRIFMDLLFQQVNQVDLVNCRKCTVYIFFHGQKQFYLR